GLAPGAEVRFRGMPVGEVRRIEIAPAGTHVDIQLRIREAHRATVRDGSSFWIARPRLSGALLSGLAVEDIGALLTPYVGYHTEGERGTPVPDGYRTAVSAERPEVEEAVPAAALVQEPDPRPAAGASDPSVRLVSVVYEVEERDWLSANDFEH